MTTQHRDYPEPPSPEVVDALVDAFARRRRLVEEPDGPTLKCNHEVRVDPIDHRRVRVEWRTVPDEWQEAGVIDLLGRDNTTITVMCPVEIRLNAKWRVT